MITVEQAERLLSENAGDLGAEIIPLEQALGRVLAENITAEQEAALTVGQLITPAMISLAASVGETELRVKRLPRVAILSIGNEPVESGDMPSHYQVARSNNYLIKAVLTQSGINAATLHLPDDIEIIRQKIAQCLQHYDVILLTGSLSTGEFDNVLRSLKKSGIEQLLYKVKQHPGESFWFGKHNNGVTVFAFSNDPSATLIGMHRYFIPWLNITLTASPKPPVYAVLDCDFTFEPQLKYFLPVKLNFTQQGQLLAAPAEGNNSSDFISLANTDAFMELPLEKKEFKKGEVYRVWLLD